MSTATFKYPSYSDRCFNEATAAAIFLLQHRYYAYTHERNPTGEDGEEIEPDDDFDFYDKSADRNLTGEDFVRQELATEHWRTESVWLSREEATAFAEKTAYNFPDGWRVYSMPAKGDLVERLKDLEDPLNPDT